MCVYLKNTGIDHLLPKGDAKAEAQMACFMSLLSHLASKPEVLRVEPLHGARPANAVARAIVQSATETNTPLSDAGLDGTGEVIQVINGGDYRQARRWIGPAAVSVCRFNFLK